MTNPLKVAIVTGAGSGIGKGVAMALLQKGYAVTLAGRRKDKLEAALKESGADPARGLVVQTDVGDATSVRHLFEATLRFPNVIADFTKNLIADHHPRAAFIAMLQPNESGIAKLLVQVRPFARQNVGVNVDFHEKVTSDL